MTPRRASWLAGAAHAVLASLNLHGQSLWLDEVMSYEAVRYDWAQLAGFFRRLPEQHPLYYLILRGWLTLGESAIALRALSVLFGALAVVAIVRLAERTAGARASYLAAGLCVISPFVLYYSQEARPYTLLALLAALATLTWLQWQTQPTRSKLALYAIISVLGAYTHLFFIFLLGSHLIAQVVQDGWRTPRWRRLLTAQVGIGICYLPWALLLVTHASGPQSWKGAANVVFGVPYTFLRFAVGYGLVPMNMGWKEAVVGLVQADALPLALSASGTGVLATVGALSLWRAHEGRLVLSTLIVPMILALIASIAIILVGEKYFIICFPAFVVTVAAGGEALLAKGRVWLLRLAILAVVLSSAWSVARLSFDPTIGKEDWRRVAALVQEDAASGDVIVVSPGYARSAFQFYFRAPPGVSVQPGDAGDGVPSEAARVWVVFAVGHAKVAGEAARREHYVATLSASHDQVVDTLLTKGTGIEVLRFDARAN